MATVEYQFFTIWRIEAPLQAVWAAIHDSQHWPEWWKNVEGVAQIEAGTSDGLGAVQRYTWKGWLPYRLVFDMRVTRIEPLVALEGEATGDVEGIGRWRFSTDRNVSVICYEWRVRTRRSWMNALAPLARPFFQWNHDTVMREGGLGLARRLDARLISIEHG
ncbi:SRPBCC family protein [Paraburkholderia sp.]|uniref:SRPBCC family protein n=1 Tax=Paraburkholderia sp. TaxID=1926495 RepID=UPI002F42C993